MSSRRYPSWLVLMVILQIGGLGVSAAGPVPLTVELDNSAVQIVRLRLAPHATIPMHKASARVVVFLTDAHLRLTFPDGHHQEVRYKAGEVVWLPSQKHAGENLSDHAVELIGVIPKSAHQ